MREVTFTLYRFDELPSEEAQACAVHAQRGKMHISSDLWEANQAIEELCSTLKSLGVVKVERGPESLDFEVSEAAKYALAGLGKTTIRWLILTTFRKNDGRVGYDDDGNPVVALAPGPKAVEIDEALLRPLNEFLADLNDNRRFEEVIDDCKRSLRADLERRLEHVRSAEYIREFLRKSELEFNKYGDQMDLPDFAREF